MRRVVQDPDLQFWDSDRTREISIRRNLHFFTFTILNAKEDSTVENRDLPEHCSWSEWINTDSPLTNNKFSGIDIDDETYLTWAKRNISVCAAPIDIQVRN